MSTFGALGVRHRRVDPQSWLARRRELVAELHLREVPDPLIDIQVADGRRWPGLQLIAQVEETFREDATGYSVVLHRKNRAGTHETR